MGCYVNYKIAKKLKEKGFSLNNEDVEFIGCRFIFSDECTIKRISMIGAYEKGYFGENIDCPTISQILKWLREEKKIHIMIDIWKEDVNDIIYKWGYDIVSLTTTEVIGCDTQCANTYEQAALAGIEYVLDNFI